MSLFGSSSKTTNVYTPAKAPPPPTRGGPETQRQIYMGYRRAFTRGRSYTQSLIGGNAPEPTKSYTAQLYGTGGI